MSFQPGEVVQLKSGGPRMTVEEIEGDQVDCTWFEKNKQHHGSFKSILLSKAGSGIAVGRIIR